MNRAKLLVTVFACAAALAFSLPTGAQPVGMQDPPDQVCDDPARSITLFAAKKGKTQIGYGLQPGKPRIPGPTIEMTEGECIHVTLVNDTDRSLSLHTHGVSYTVNSDGTRLNRTCVGPGRSRTYVFEASEPSARPDGTLDPGSAGYWHYHDHCMGTPHGTVGINKGLFGALIIRRPGDPVPDANPKVLVMSGTRINLKRAPNTPVVKARLGERVEFVVIGHGELHHTFHLHGHRWMDNRTGMPSSPGDSAQIIDNKTVGPADSFGFQVIAGEGVGPGAWMYHCHVQGHSDAGMEGIFLVSDEMGTATAGARRALAAWRNTHATH